MRAILLLAVLASTLSGAASGQGKADLRLRLESGQPYTLRVALHQVFSQALLGQSRDISQDLEYVYTLSVNGRDDKGVMDVAVSYESANVRRDVSDQVFGTEPAAPAIAADTAARNKLYGALAGQGFSMRVDPQGNVLGIQGTDAIVTHLSGVLKPDGDQERQLLEHDLREQFGQDATREAMQRLFGIFPPGPVAVGDSWERAVELTKGFPFKIHSTYTLKSLENGAATIDVRSDVAADPRPITSPPGSGEYRYELNGGQTGTIVIETASGWYRSGNLALQAFGHVTYAAGKGLGGTRAPLSVKTDTTIGSLAP